jgi:hypothetical protein
MPEQEDAKSVPSPFGANMMHPGANPLRPIPVQGERLKFLMQECGCLAEVNEGTKVKTNDKVIEVEVKEVKKALVSFE